VRVALVHDYLCTYGGSDRVFSYMCEAIPEADVYTLALNRRRTLRYFAARSDIRTTWMNGLVRDPATFRLWFPLATYAMQRLDLGAYDLVISSAATVARYVRAPRGRHVCYCYIPTRAVWQFDEYFGDSLKGKSFRPLLPFLKRRERETARHTDEYIAISAVSQAEILRCYGRPSRILPCPVDVGRFQVSADRKPHFLIVSRLERSKRVDYAVEAFSRLGLPLRIVGTGPEFGRLRRLAAANVEFLGAIDDAALAREYATARAVVYTPMNEYGLTPLEANASGTPVIAYGAGGTLETMRPAETDDGATDATAIFFDTQSAEALSQAVRRFERLSFDPRALRRHAERWSVEAFQVELRRMVGLG
jgi:glycosyltransferase involved in cell wall biosynthesis